MFPPDSEAEQLSQFVAHGFHSHSDSKGLLLSRK